MSRTAAQILETLGEDLPTSLFDAIQAAANQAIQDIKSNLVTDPQSSGYLRSSIRAVVNESDYTVGLIMADYGYYQNFGVAGVNNQTTQTPLDDITKEAFGVTGFSFKKDVISSESGLPFGARRTIAQNGLNAKDFFAIEQFTNDIVSYVNQNLEL